MAGAVEGRAVASVPARRLAALGPSNTPVTVAVTVERGIWGAQLWALPWPLILHARAAGSR